MAGGVVPRVEYQSLRGPCVRLRLSDNARGARQVTNYPVCAFFDSRDDAYAVLTPFYREGLEWGEKAVHIVDPALRQDHKHRLREAGIEGDRTVELLRAAGSEITEPSSPWWNIVKTFDTASPSAAHIDSPAGRLRVAYVPLGYRGGDGSSARFNRTSPPSPTASPSARRQASPIAPFRRRDCSTRRCRADQTWRPRRAASNAGARRAPLDRRRWSDFSSDTARRRACQTIRRGPPRSRGPSGAGTTRSQGCSRHHERAQSGK